LAGEVFGEVFSSRLEYAHKTMFLPREFFGIQVYHFSQSSGRRINPGRGILIGIYINALKLPSRSVYKPHQFAGVVSTLMMPNDSLNAFF